MFTDHHDGDDVPSMNGMIKKGLGSENGLTKDYKYSQEISQMVRSARFDGMYGTDGLR